MTNVFVLCTGRSGSTTFIRAASHIRNYSSGHETRSALVGDDRFAYPPNHVEADNRLSWLLGRLDATYGRNAKYVHLIRDPASVVRSFERRWNDEFGIIRAYRKSIIMRCKEEDRARVCMDYVDTVTANIRAFLKDKPQWIEFRVENAEGDWKEFWKWCGADGDLEASLREWSVAYNSSTEREGRRQRFYRAISKHVSFT